MATSTHRAAALGVICALAPGCWYFHRDGMAILLFSQINLCPRERITVTEIAPDPPPADLASDPERLAMWQSRNGGYAYYRLVGCGRSDVYRCHTMGKCGIARVEGP